MRSWLVACAAALMPLALSACDPCATSGTTNGVSLTVDVDIDGSVTTSMLVDGTRGSDTELRSWGEAVGSRLFPTVTSLDVRINPNTGSVPFVVIDASGVYRPGPRPQVTTDRCSCPETRRPGPPDQLVLSLSGYGVRTSVAIARLAPACKPTSPPGARRIDPPVTGIC